jgi:RNA polymerase sigma factor (sigma-70 family)
MLPLHTDLETLYRAHARKLRGFTRRRVGAQEAEDVVQEAYLHALEEGGVASSTYPRAYLFRIAANLTIDATRKAKVRLRYAESMKTLQFPIEDASRPGATIEHLVELGQLCAILGELPSPCRKAFILYWLHDLTHLETARRLGVTVRTVERHLLKAREHLRRRVGR